MKELDGVRKLEELICRCLVLLLISVYPSCPIMTVYQLREGERYFYDLTPYGPGSDTSLKTSTRSLTSKNGLVGYVSIYVPYAKKASSSVPCE